MIRNFKHHFCVELLSCLFHPRTYPTIHSPLYPRGISTSISRDIFFHRLSLSLSLEYLCFRIRPLWLSPTSTFKADEASFSLTLIPVSSSLKTFCIFATNALLSSFGCVATSQSDFLLLVFHTEALFLCRKRVTKHSSFFSFLAVPFLFSPPSTNNHRPHPSSLAPYCIPFFGPFNELAGAGLALIRDLAFVRKWMEVLTVICSRLP